jgi:hypothetical protein
MISGFGLNDLPSPLKDAVETLYCSFDKLRTHLGIQKSNASVFAILQQYPCAVRCIDELKKPNNNDDIDKLYMAKETYSKQILIDEIHSRFGNSIKLEEKYKISSGTLDLAIVLDPQKIIGIEIKNGSSEQTYVKLLHEIERYLIHTYLLLVVRVHTKSVHPMVRDINSLIRRIECVTEKANLITSIELSSHKCKWCDYKLLPESNNGLNKKLDHVADIDMSFYSNTLEVVKMTIAILEKEFSNQNIPERNGEMIQQQDHTKIRDDSFESLSKNNVDGHEVSDVRRLDNENGNTSDERGSIKWHSIKELTPGMYGVNVKGKIDHLMPPRTIKDGTEKVVEAKISDSTGKINLALFNGQSENVKEGDEVYIENGYTSSKFNSVNTLYVGRNGIVKFS